MKKSQLKNDLDKLLSSEMTKVKGGAKPCMSCKSSCQVCHSVSKKSA